MVAWRALRGAERPNATRLATHSDMIAKNRQEPAVNRLRFTDRTSDFEDFAVRQIGAGEHGGRVQDVADSRGLALHKWGIGNAASEMH